MFLYLLLSLVSACHCQPTVAPWMTAAPPAPSPLPPMIIEPYTPDPGYYMVALLREPNQLEQPFQQEQTSSTLDNGQQYRNQAPTLLPYTAPPAPPTNPDNSQNSGNFLIPDSGQYFANPPPIISENRPAYASSGFAQTPGFTDNRQNLVISGNDLPPGVTENRTSYVSSGSDQSPGFTESQQNFVTTGNGQSPGITENRPNFVNSGKFQPPGITENRPNYVSSGNGQPPGVTENRPILASSGNGQTLGITENRQNYASTGYGNTVSRHNSGNRAPSHDHPRNTQGVRNLENRPHLTSGGNKQNNGNNIRPNNIQVFSENKQITVNYARPSAPQFIPENRQNIKTGGKVNKQNLRNTNQFTSNAEKNFHMKNIQPFINNIITHGDSAESFSNQIQYTEKPPKIANNRGKNGQRKRQNFVVDIQKSIEIPFEHMPYASEMSDILSSTYFNKVIESSSTSPITIEMTPTLTTAPSRHVYFAGDTNNLRDNNDNPIPPTAGLYDNAVKDIFQGNPNMPMPTLEMSGNFPYPPAQPQMPFSEQLQAKESRNYQNNQIQRLQNVQNQMDIIQNTMNFGQTARPYQNSGTPENRFNQEMLEGGDVGLNPAQEMAYYQPSKERVKNVQNPVKSIKETTTFQPNRNSQMANERESHMKDRNAQKNANSIKGGSPEKNSDKPTSISLFRPETVQGFQQLFEKTNSEKVTKEPDSEAEGDAISFYVAKNPVNIFVDDPELVKVMSKYYKGSLAQFLEEPMALQRLSKIGRTKKLKNL